LYELNKNNKNNNKNNNNNNNNNRPKSEIVNLEFLMLK
jgi:hypothetical protein